MKLNGIRLVDGESPEIAFWPLFEKMRVREEDYSSLPSFSPIRNNLPPETDGIRFKLNKSMFRAETPEQVSTGKKLELHLGDITNLGFPVDLLTVSAFRGSYGPTPGTVMESLYRRGIHVHDLSRVPELDFRENMGIWLSKATGIKEIAQLVCLEVIGRVISFKEALHNLFSFLTILETRGKQPASISIPLLGTGNQGFDKAEVIPALLDESLRFLQIARAIKEIHFVVFSEKDAAQFSAELDTQLGKGQLFLSDGKTIDHIKKLPPGMGWILRQPK
jgi:hypothetical protein